MKYWIVIGLLLGILSCTDKSIAETDLHLLNGYWEITTVEFADGTKKEYTVNTTIDFIQLNQFKGIKSKVQPKLDGTYTSTKDVEPFSILKKDDEFLLQYKNGLNQWTEQLKQLDSLNFSIKDKEGITYTYKRYEPINIIP
ncbi:hypothetical protein [Flavobacterium sp. ASW18X]|uniref:hypothetical protein n=1 Tax=Flavobacterium sp. ASW18X TaxID=2572595 RepID=UPI0010AE521F|nr:hypothetical protein [Flavobacterium sp. ASW18X]TKD62467.1 hypothetical protein FBT53_09530 [Flavobacterium sp. ASW18X]